MAVTNEEEFDWKLHYISVRRLRDFYEQLGGKLHTVQDMTDLGKILIDDKYLVDRDLYEAPEPPTMTASGTWDYSATITITAVTEGSTITYTVNGTTTVTNLSSVTLTLEQDENLETKIYSVSAVAVRNGLPSTPPVTGVYNVNRRVATPSFSPTGSTYNVTKSVTISCDTSGTKIYYTTDGSDPKTSQTRQPYSSAISIEQTTTLKAYAEEIVQPPQTTKTWVDSLTNSATYTLKVYNPKITVSGDEYDTSRTITLSCDDNEAEIYYRYGTTGSWTKYTAALTLTSTKHIYVESRRTGWTSGTAHENITVGTKYTHAGLSDLADVSSSTTATLLPQLIVTEQGGLKKPSPAGKYTFTTGNAEKYIWFAVPRNYSITEVANGAVPQQFTMKYDDTTGGYKYYRMDGKMVANETITLTVTA